MPTSVTIKYLAIHREPMPAPKPGSVVMTAEQVKSCKARLDSLEALLDERTKAHFTATKSLLRKESLAKKLRKGLK